MSLKTKILVVMAKILYKTSGHLHVWAVSLLGKSCNMFKHAAARMYYIDKRPDGAETILTFIDENPLHDHCGEEEENE